MDKDAPLKEIVKKIIKNLEKKERDKLDISKIWERTVGKKASKHTRAAFLKSKRLVVNVSDSSWLYSLAMEKEKLIKKLNSSINGRKKIREIQFRIGEVKKENYA